MQATHRRSCSSAAGASLIEVVTAMVVVAILASLAAPSMAALVERGRTVATLNQLVSHMHLTRSLAVNQRSDAVLCPSENGQSCTGGADWSGGWIAFADPDGDHQPGADERVALHERREATMPVRVYSSSGRTRLRYRADGLAGGANLTLTLCQDGRLSARIVVNNAGRPRSEMLDGKASCPLQ